MKRTNPFRLSILATILAVQFASFAQEPGATVTTNKFEPKSIKQWTLKGPLSEKPRRVTEDLPLSDQQNHGRWQKVPAMSDEFNGAALDTNKWNRGIVGWRGRKPAWFNPTNVWVHDGQLHLAMRKEHVPADLEKQGYHDYSSAALHHRTRTLYGYYEVKARAMGSGGSSSFWFHQEDQAANPGWRTEVDVFELCGKNPKHDRLYHMTLHTWQTPEEKRHWQVGSSWEAPARFSEDFHVFGFDWEEKELLWYVDGVLVHRVENTHWHQPLILTFDSETMPEWFGMPNDADLPSTFSIEYLRVWTAAK